MSVHSNTPGMTSTVNQWSRVLGISLRPWSGYSPLSMLLRGAIQVAICVFLLVLMVGMRNENFTGMEGELAILKNFTLLAIIALVVLSTLALLRVLVGILDLFPRRTEVGKVVSLRQRMAGDLLPHMAQRLIFENKDTGLDRRRHRTEVVLHTAEGLKQWTVRNSRVRKELNVGAEVALVVSPLLGYVAEVQPAR